MTYLPQGKSKQYDIDGLYHIEIKNCNDKEIEMTVKESDGTVYFRSFIPEKDLDFRINGKKMVPKSNDLLQGCIRFFDSAFLCEKEYDYLFMHSGFSLMIQCDTVINGKNIIMLADLSMK